MKNFILTVALTFISISLFAISDYEIQDDTTRLKTKKKTILIVQDGEDNFDFEDDTTENEGIQMVLSVDLGMNGYLTKSNSMGIPSTYSLMELNYAKSSAFGTNLMLKGANISKEWLYISPGIGISTNNYSFKNNIRIGVGNDSTVFSEDTLLLNDKYKLRATYIQVPLVLGFRFGKKTPVGIQLGAIGGYKIGSRVKQKYYLADSDTKLKNKIQDDYNINPFKVDLIARVSIGDIGLYAKYAVTTLFESNKALELYPFSIGFTFGGF